MIVVENQIRSAAKVYHSFHQIAVDMQDLQENARKFLELCELCKSPVQEILKRRDLIVVSHVDADGLTSAAIVCARLNAF